jgi:hypothetical protein
MIDSLFDRFTGCLDVNDLRTRRNARKTNYDRSLSVGDESLRSILGDLWKLIVGPIWEEIKDLVSNLSH